MVLVLPASALAGCGDSGGSRDRDPGVDPGLGPITYVVTGVTQDGAQHALVAGTAIRVRFADGQVTLTAGCNTMSGKYALEETRLTVEPFATTDMGCDQARMDQDTWLAGLFEKPVQLITGDDASLVSGATVLALADREKASPDKPLVGTTWLLDTVTNGTGADGTASSVHDGGALVLKDDGFTIQWACENQGGRYRIDGARLSFATNVHGTGECVPPVTDEEEPGKLLRQVITGSASYAIEENRLTITKGDVSLGFRAKG